MESSQLITLLGLGLILGLKHALDADHVIAISTIVSQTRSLKRSSLYGIIWGIGHTFTLFLVGLIILGFKFALPDKMSLFFEFTVGIVLVVLGVDVLRKAVKHKLHIHKHSHGNTTHAHIHTHKETPSHGHTHRSFIIGMLHGLAGSGVLTLLVLSTVNSLLLGLFYILIFGIGSLIGMLMVSAVIGLPFMFTTRFGKVNILIELLAGTVSIVFGCVIMYEIGYVHGLFYT